MPMTDLPALQELIRRKKEEEIRSQQADAALEDTEVLEQTLGLKPFPEETKPYEPSEGILNLLKESEGSISKQTDLGSFRDGRFFPYKSIEGGKDTIGYGDKDTVSNEEMERYRKFGMSTEDADNRLKENSINYLAEAGKNLERPIEEFLPKNTAEALSSYFINTGTNPKKHPSLYKALSEAEYADSIGDEIRKSQALNEVLNQMDIVKSNGKVLKGLQTRREKEQEYGSKGLMSPFIQEKMSPVGDTYEKLNEQQREQVPQQEQIRQDLMMNQSQEPNRSPANQNSADASSMVEMKRQGMGDLIKPESQDPIQAQLELQKQLADRKESSESERARRMRNAQLIEGIAQMLGGFAGTASGFKTPVNIDSKGTQSVIDAEYKARVANEKRDPQSEISKIYQKYAKRLMPKSADSIESASALELEKLMPLFSKQIERQQDLQDELTKIAAKQQFDTQKEKSKIDTAEKKQELKEQTEIKKENREEVKNTKKSLKTLEEKEDLLKEAKDILSGMSISDTGPIDQFISPLSDQGQKLRKIFNQLALKEMGRLFEGMSKAVDSDAERRFFEQSQLSMGDYANVNLENIQKQLDRIQNIKRQSNEFISSIDETGERKQSKPKEGFRQPRSGEVIVSGGKRYRVLDEEGNLEEL